MGSLLNLVLSTVIIFTTNGPFMSLTSLILRYWEGNVINLKENPPYFQKTLSLQKVSSLKCCFDAHFSYTLKRASTVKLQLKHTDHNMSSGFMGIDPFNGTILNAYRHCENVFSQSAQLPQHLSSSVSRTVSWLDWRTPLLMEHSKCLFFFFSSALPSGK